MTNQWANDSVAIANHFHEIHPNFNYHGDAICRELKDICDNKPPINVIELGCGNGRLARFLSKYNTSYYGVDINKMCIEAANKHLKKNQTFEVYDIEQNQFWDTIISRKFDLCIVDHVLSIIHDPISLLQKISCISDQILVCDNIHDNNSHIVASSFKWGGMEAPSIHNLFNGQFYDDIQVYTGMLKILSKHGTSLVSLYSKDITKQNVELIHENLAHITNFINNLATKSIDQFSVFADHVLQIKNNVEQILMYDQIKKSRIKNLNEFKIKLQQTLSDSSQILKSIDLEINQLLPPKKIREEKKNENSDRRSSS